nr:AmiS/UreI family transporter [Cephaloticoccus primus]
MTLLFSLNYLWVALNRTNGADGRGLGWFSLLVAVTAAVVSGETLWHAATLWDFWNGLSWAAWAVLWALFFVILVLRRDIGRITGILAIVLGVSTGLLPGYLLLSGLL